LHIGGCARFGYKLWFSHGKVPLLGLDKFSSIAFANAPIRTLLKEINL
jgi:hypothetical protein